MCTKPVFMLLGLVMCLNWMNPDRIFMVVAILGGDSTCLHSLWNFILDSPFDLHCCFLDFNLDIASLWYIDHWHFWILCGCRFTLIFLFLTSWCIFWGVVELECFSVLMSGHFQCYLFGELKTSTFESSFEKTLRIPMIRSSHDPPRGSSPPLAIFNTRIATQPLSPPHAGNPVPTLQVTTSTRSTFRISDVTALSNQQQPPVRSPPVPPPLATTHQDAVTSLHPRDSRSTSSINNNSESPIYGCSSFITATFATHQCFSSSSELSIYGCLDVSRSPIYSCPSFTWHMEIVLVLCTKLISIVCFFISYLKWFEEGG